MLSHHLKFTDEPKENSLNYFFRPKDIIIAQEIIKGLHKDQLVVIEGKAGVGKTTLARFIAKKMQNEVTVHWLDCGGSVKFENSLKHLSRILKVPENLIDIPSIIRETKSALLELPRKVLLILDDVRINEHIRDFTKYLPINTSILITTQIENPKVLENKFYIDSYTFDEIQSFIDTTTDCQLKVTEYTALSEVIKIRWKNAEIKLPVYEVNQIAHFLNDTIVRKLHSAINTAQKKIEIIQNHLSPENISIFILKIFSFFKNEALDLVCRSLYLDADFIDLNLLNYPPKATYVNFNAFINELSHYGIVYRTENNFGDKGFTFNKLFQQKLRSKVNCNVKMILSDILSAVEFYTTKIMLGNYRAASESHKAYFHALKLIAYDNQLENSQILRLLNCVTDYQRFWRIDRSLCMVYEHEKLQKLSQDSHDYETHCSNAYFSMGLSHIAFEQTSEALQCFTRVIGMRTRLHGSGYYTLFSVYHKIGLCHFMRQEYENGIENLERAVAIMKSYKDRAGVFLAMKNEAQSVFNLMGLCCDRLGDEDRAKYFLKKSLKIRREMHNCDHHREMAESYENLAKFYARQRKLKKAVDNYKLALEHFRSYYGEVHEVVAGVNQNIGALYDRRRLYDKAVRFYAIAMDINEKIYGERRIKCAVLAETIIECESKASKFWNRVKQQATSLKERSSDSSLIRFITLRPQKSKLTFHQRCRAQPGTSGWF